MPSYKVDNFSGGIVDLVTDPNPNSSYEMINFFLDQDGKMVRRSGVETIGNAATFPAAPFPVIGIFEIPKSLNDSPYPYAESDVFYLSLSGKLYNLDKDTDTWNEVLGVGGYSFGTSRINNGLRIERYRDLVLLVADGTPPIILFHDDATGDWRLVSAGLPKPADPTSSNTQMEAGAADGPYSWTFIFAYEFTTTNGITYRITSAPTAAFVDTGLAPGRIQSTVNHTMYTDSSSLPRHYPATAVLEMYRTEDSGATHLLKGKLGVTIATDYSFTYAQSVPTGIGGDLFSGPELYVDVGETEDNEMPDAGALSTVTSNGVGWSVSNDNKTILRQSKPGSLFSWPQEFELGFKDEIKAVFSIGIYPIIFTMTGIYRVEGFLGTDGVGYNNIKLISESQHIISNFTGVLVDNNIYFAATDGIYVTDGFNIAPCTEHMKTRYVRDYMIDNNLSSHIRDVTYDRQNKRIYWSVDHSPSLYSVLVQDLNHRGKTGTFYHLNFPIQIHAISCGLGELYLGSRYGQVGVLRTLNSQGAFDYKNYDVDVNENVDPAVPFNERYSSISYQYQSGPMSMGNDMIRKWTTRIYTTLHRLTQNVTLGLYSINDLRSDTRAKLHPVLNRSGVVGGIKTFKRHFPARHLRSTYKQIEYTNVSVLLYESVNFSQATVSGSNIILDSGTWPTDILRQVITIGGNSYEISNVQSGGSDTIAVSGTPTAGPGQDWVIRGTPRNEQIKIENYVIEYTPIGEGYKDSKDDGEA